MRLDDFKITIRNDIIQLYRNSTGSKTEILVQPPLLAVYPKSWDSAFFKKKFGAVQLEDPDNLNRLTDFQVAVALERLTASVDENHYDIIELTIDIDQTRLIPLFEDVGFRLVDSRITFITPINRKAFPPEPLPAGTIKYASWDDLEAIVTLTYESFVDNDQFFSRFKNRRYFTEDETRRYYREWIANHIGDADTHFIVVKDNDRLYAYYIYKKTRFLEEKPVYKAILTAVDPAFRGNRFHMRMQAYLIQQFPEEAFFLDNTSQLTNISIIRSYIRSQKQLNSIALTFYREKNPECLK